MAPSSSKSSSSNNNKSKSKSNNNNMKKAAASLSSSRPIHVMHWFRHKSLRLHDNPSLTDSLSLGPTKIYPVYVVDGDAYEFQHCTPTKCQFGIECVQDLDHNLRQQYQSRLYCVKGDPTTLLPQLWQQWNITHLSFAADETGEPYGKERDETVMQAAQDAGITVHTVASETLFPLQDYVDNASSKNGDVPATMTGFQKLFERLQKKENGMAKALPAPKAEHFPSSCQDNDKDDKEDDQYNPPTHVTQIPWPRTINQDDVQPIWNAADCKNLTPIVRGGETEARNALQSSLQDATYVATFSKPHTSCTTPKGKPSTTGLSPYLSWGCLSPREVWYAVDDALQRAPKSVKPTTPPVSLHGQLLWRDFNHLMAYDTNRNAPGTWGHMVPEHKHCRQVPWDDDPNLQQAWRTGQTGYPWIDACMRQLQSQGWIHHLGRHAVACFLTRGDLWQSWEHGATHFEATLLDADYALNGFNWLWLSCSGFFYQYFRCYSPISFQKKNDPSGQYIRTFCPELAKLPDKYIYEPWEAPPNVLKQAGVTLGKNYPHRIVEDHTATSKANMARMKQAYDEHKEREKEKEEQAKKKARTKK